MVAGAKAGIKQKGNSVKTSTPKFPVSMEAFVNQKAKNEVIKISSSPKVFLINACFLAYFFLF